MLRKKNDKKEKEKHEAYYEQKIDDFLKLKQEKRWLLEMKIMMMETLKYGQKTQKMMRYES